MTEEEIKDSTEEIQEKFVDFYNDMLYFRDSFLDPKEEQWHAMEDLLLEYREQFNVSLEEI